MRLDDRQMVVYTRGSVEFFRTYPGMYVPRPLLLCCHEVGQSLGLDWLAGAEGFEPANGGIKRVTYLLLHLCCIKREGRAVSPHNPRYVGPVRSPMTAAPVPGPAGVVGHGPATEARSG